MNRAYTTPMLLFLAIVCIAACNSEPSPPRSASTASSTPRPNPLKLPIKDAREALHRAIQVPEARLVDALNVIDKKTMRPILERLASDAFEGRKTGSEGIRKARTFLVEHLRESGLQPLKGKWTSTWDTRQNFQNVWAFYPGTDPLLRHEVIVVGAHYDHIGLSKKRRKRDRIFNGADDNASGTTAILTVALALGKTQLKLRRSVLFVWFSGEEEGLYGSTAYCDNPPIPLERTAAMINLDMVGRNPKHAAGLFGVSTSPVFSKLIAQTSGIVPDARVQAIAGLGALKDRSDQQPFRKRGVPVLVFHTGVHGDYHKVTDHSDRIAYDRLAALTRFATALVVELANYPKSLRPAKP